MKAKTPKHLEAKISAPAYRRFEDWERRLAEFLEQSRLRPFAWGKHDCCLFASEAIRVQTGIDIAEIKHFRGNYSDEHAGYKLLFSTTKTRSLRLAIGRLMAEFDFPLLPNPLLAQRGDLVLIKDHRGRYVVGIVDLDGRWVACLTPKGLTRVPLERALIAWKV